MAFAPFFNFRNRLLSSGRFRRIAEKLPFGQWFARSHAERLFRIASGFIHSQVLLACVRLSLFEHLRRRALSTEEIASATGYPKDRLRHLLAAAAALRLLERRGDDRFGLGPLGASMNDNRAVEAFVLHHAALYEDLADPLQLFREVGDTRLSRLWSYADSDAPEELATEDVEAYTALMSDSQSMVAEQVLSAFSLKERKSLLDIGGGNAAFARAVAKRYPDIAITVADLPAVADLARETIREAGLSRRIDVIGVDASAGDMPGRYDVVSLVRILHDHDDETAVEILRTAKEALTEQGTLLIAEPLAGKTAAGSLNDAYFQVYLLAMGSGRPRRLDEIENLLIESGYANVKRHRTRVPLITSVISANALTAETVNKH